VILASPGTSTGAGSYIVMTEKEKQRLLALLPDADNIESASLPIFHAFKHTGLPKTELRRQLGLPADRNIVLFFGFIRPYKGLHVLIDAMQILTERGSQADLLAQGCAVSKSGPKSVLHAAWCCGSGQKH